MNSLFNLCDKVVVVTGGLGQLGSYYSQELLKSGAKVAIIDNSTSTNKFSKEFEFFMEKGHLNVYPVDITDRDGLIETLTKVKDDLGTPYGLINNAAMDSPPNAPPSENGAFETYSEDSWDKVISVNLKGCFLCCQVFGAEMARIGEGSIVNISSIYGIVSPDQSLYNYRRDRGEIFFKPIGYSVSKSGILNLTRYLSVYWAKSNIRVNTLTLSGVFNGQDEGFLEAYCKRIPIGRMANPDDFIGSIFYLLSKASKYTTGTNLIVDGGWTAI